MIKTCPDDEAVMNLKDQIPNGWDNLDLKRLLLDAFARRQPDGKEAAKKLFQAANKHKSMALIGE
jgi:hypothetical protein